MTNLCVWSLGKCLKTTAKKKKNTKGMRKQIERKAYKELAQGIHNQVIMGSLT